MAHWKLNTEVCVIYYFRAKEYVKARKTATNYIMLFIFNIPTLLYIYLSIYSIIYSTVETALGELSKATTAIITSRIKENLPIL